MNAQSGAIFAAILTWRRAKLCRRCLNAAMMFGGLAIVAGCTAAPSQPRVGPDPSDAHIRVPAVGYRSTIGPFVSQRPAEPGDWKGTNERVTPQQRSGQ